MVVQMMKNADVDGDGQIDYNEFVAATMNISKLEKDELIQKTFMVGKSGRARGSRAPMGRRSAAMGNAASWNCVSCRLLRAKAICSCCTLLGKLRARVCSFIPRQSQVTAACCACR